MDKARLTYFEIRGRAEPARLMLEDNGAEYESVFVELEEWPKVKNDFKFGQLPVFSDDKRTVEESFAIYSYLARKFDLVPKTENEIIRHDQVNSLILTSSYELGLLFWNSEFEKKRGEMRDVTLPNRLKNLENFYAETTGPYWLGEKIHYADYGVWCYLDTVRMFSEETLNKFPGLMRFKTTMEKRPRIHAYLRSDRRPKRFTVPIAPFGGQIDEWQPAPV